MVVDLSMIPHIRTSERKDFKRCQQRWVWAWRQGLRPKIEKPGALWFGIGMHLVLQHRYQYRGKRRGKNLLKVWRDYVGDTKAIVFADDYADTGEFYNAAELGEIMIGAYLDRYGVDPSWYVLSAEQTFELPIPYPREMRKSAQAKSRGGTLAYYNGTFDLVVIDEAADDSAMVVDHKNMKQISTTHLPLDDQAGSYWAVAGDVLAAQGLIQPGVRLDGIIYNFLRKAKPDPRPTDADGFATNKPTKQHYIDALNASSIAFSPDDKPWEKYTVPQLEQAAEKFHLKVIGERSKVQPAPNFLRYPVWRTRDERRTQIERIQNEALQMDALRARVLRPTKNPTKDCSWDCSFFNLCQLHEARDDWQTFRDSSFVREDPYAAHRDVVASE